MKDLGIKSPDIKQAINNGTLKFKVLKLLAPTNKSIKCHINIFSKVDKNDKNIHNVGDLLEFFKSMKFINIVKIWRLTYDLTIL